VGESFRDLIAWQKGMALITDVYRATESFPKRERYGLVDQLCRATVSIPSDIAEGRGRLSKKEFLQMVARARGSSYEVQTQLEASRNVGFLTPETFEDLIEKAGEVSRLLNGLIKNMKQQIAEDERHPPNS
jgi:four helix bundle protein